ncbi:MAG: HalOD1 output domain-containing protein [Halosimplex sp.]
MDALVRTDAQVTDTDELALAIASAVAESKAAPVSELSPLYDRVDVEALAALFESMPEGSDAGRVSFPFAGRAVDVRADGTVVVSGLDVDASAATARTEGGSA